MRHEHWEKGKDYVSVHFFLLLFRAWPMFCFAWNKIIHSFKPTNLQEAMSNYVCNFPKHKPAFTLNSCIAQVCGGEEVGMAWTSLSNSLSNVFLSLSMWTNNCNSMNASRRDRLYDNSFSASVFECGCPGKSLLPSTMVRLKAEMRQLHGQSLKPREVQSREPQSTKILIIN